MWGESAGVKDMWGIMITRKSCVTTHCGNAAVVVNGGRVQKLVARCRIVSS